ncbi:phenyltransferase domain-containing protein [Desulfonema ishimotonii]|uniref:Phenyltransferase domain-containing protein n=1 Tax=Desulfonema ishimotonii TaxID=45657 RepID=A0A401G3Q7_9BACT|nr:phenyltransferase domain-containing protein [Desulfonema ishimotonii]GBC63833.1 phenyltransferase domain-containing protein [Desulfonema ishimotonii]
MKQNISGRWQQSSIDVETVAGLIADEQRPSGEIPWHSREKTDPWDHVEAAIGLGTGGYLREAERAFEWMARMQLEDGSWYSAYRDGTPEDLTRESNMSSYIAVGVFHHYLLTGNRAFLSRMWPVVARAIAFTLTLRAPEGEMYWAVSPEGNIDPMALLTGSSSIYMSLKCAIAIAEKLGYARPPAWAEAARNLKAAIRHRPHCFNVTKARYSMDWFYPILSGALTGEAARKRIDKYWKKFVIQGEGVRCVSDRPWVTIAETSECCIALAAMGNARTAGIMFNWICDKRYEDGAYWCGHTCPDMTIWPEERITWTNAVVLMAADALFELTPASRLFFHRFWETFAEGI